MGNRQSCCIVANVVERMSWFLKKVDSFQYKAKKCSYIPNESAFVCFFAWMKLLPVSLTWLRVRTASLGFGPSRHGSSVRPRARSRCSRRGSNRDSYRACQPEGKFKIKGKLSCFALEKLLVIVNLYARQIIKQ